MTERASTILFVVSAQGCFVFLIDHLVHILLLVIFIILSLGSSFFLVLFIVTTLAVGGVGLGGGSCRLSVLSRDELLHGHVLRVGLSWLHLWDGSARHRWLVSSERHGSEELLLLNLNGRVGEIVVGVGHDRHYGYESCRSVEHKLPLRLGNLLLLRGLLWCWLCRLSIEQLISTDWLSFTPVLLLRLLRVIGLLVVGLFGRTVTGFLCLHFIFKSK